MRARVCVCVCVCVSENCSILFVYWFFLIRRTIKCNFIYKQNTGNTMVKPFDSHCFQRRFPCNRWLIRWSKGFPHGSPAKNLPAKQELWDIRVQSLGGEHPLRMVWQPTPVFLPGIFWRSLEKSHGQRSPAATVHRVARSWHNWSDFAAARWTKTKVVLLILWDLVKERARSISGRNDSSQIDTPFEGNK